MRFGEQVWVNEPQEVAESVVVAVMRRGCHKQRMVSLSRNLFGELVAFGLLGFVSTICALACVSRTLVGFIDNDHIPLLLPHPFPYIILFCVVYGCDHLSLPLPQVDQLSVVISCVDDMKCLAEEAQHFVLPLKCQGSRDDDQHALNSLP